MLFCRDDTHQAGFMNCLMDWCAANKYDITIGPRNEPVRDHLGQPIFDPYKKLFLIEFQK